MVCLLMVFCLLSSIIVYFYFFSFLIVVYILGIYLNPIFLIYPVEQTPKDVQSKSIRKIDIFTHFKYLICKKNTKLNFITIKYN